MTAKLAEDIAASDAVFVSMLAGVSLDRLAEMLGGEKKIIRIMPNTPSAVGQGLMLVSANDRVTAEELAVFKALMAESGLLDDLPEQLIDAASAVSGCGPAYAYVFVEALADGAVKCGVPRAKAMRYAAQMLLGSASLLLETGEHPGALKDAVCSPGRQYHRRCGGAGRSGIPWGGDRSCGSGLPPDKGIRIKKFPGALHPEIF